jgi:aspartyl-tRNA(Asn)/glutamyl-tRNA(Gln) amidotransferase subunit B
MIMDWEPVIGLEVHVQLATETKLFCRCPRRFGETPNTLVCPVCLGYPGALPVVNERAVDLAVRLALAVGAEVSATSRFARKSYFYPDLPKGYQITQYDDPLATGGRIPLITHLRDIRLRRLHLEEDAGKLLHERPGGGGLEGRSLVDFNRCGVPLVEVVSEPELGSPEEAQDFVRALYQLVVYLGACDGNLAEGSLRCDANVSLRPRSGGVPGGRTEIKNLNSFRNLGRALAAEIDRQRGYCRRGLGVAPETRGFDERNGTTRALRGKEAEQDYRYFPEPDLPRLEVDARRRATQAAQLPELPWDRRARLERELELPAEVARFLTSSREIADYFEAAVTAFPVDPTAVAHFVRTEVLGELKARGQELGDAVAPERCGELVAMTARGELSANAAKEVLAAIWSSGEEPEVAARRLALVQIHDPERVAGWIEEVVRSHPDQWQELLDGRDRLLGFFVGRVMERSGGRADPHQVRRLLGRRIADPETWRPAPVG